jgi:hypothetical protein
MGLRADGVQAGIGDKLDDALLEDRQEASRSTTMRLPGLFDTRKRHAEVERANRQVPAEESKTDLKQASAGLSG